MNKSTRKVDGLLFDKDGTLFDFRATWTGWASRVIDDLAAGDAAQRTRLAVALHFDLDAVCFAPTSPFIAGTNREVAEILARALSGPTADDIEDYLMHSAARAPQVETVPLAPLLDGFKAQNLGLGVLTNDSEFGARANLEGAGIVDRFDFIAGFDSGFGFKPAPDPCLACAKAMWLEPARMAMVGDSTHDLFAGRAAGMQTIAVLTGTALEHELAPHADVVLPDIGHVPAWLAA